MTEICPVAIAGRVTKATAVTIPVRSRLPTTPAVASLRNRGSRSAHQVIYYRKAAVSATTLLTQRKMRSQVAWRLQTPLRNKQ